MKISNKYSRFPIGKNIEKPFLHQNLKEANIFELVKDLINPKVRPFDCVQVEVTSCCSAKCMYCPHTTKAEKWHSEHMSAHTFVNLWPLLQNVTRVHLQGWGEPLLHPHFFDFVKLARKAGCLVSTTSCGLHLNDDIARKIVDSGIDILAFSLAGTDQESNSVRKNADFDKVYENIKLLQRVREERMAVHLEIHLAYILLADRMQALKNLPKLMKELGIHATIVSTLDYLADESQEKLAINPDDLTIIAQAKEILEKIAKEAEEGGQKIYYALPSKQPSPHCRENIQKSLYIDAKGALSPCIYLNVPYEEENVSKKLVFGNVNAENVLDIWQKENFQAFRQGHLDGDVIEQCKNCVKKFEALH